MLFTHSYTSNTYHGNFVSTTVCVLTITLHCREEEKKPNDLFCSMYRVNEWINKRTKRLEMSQRTHQYKSMNFCLFFLFFFVFSLSHTHNAYWFGIWPNRHIDKQSNSQRESSTIRMNEWKLSYDRKNWYWSSILDTYVSFNKR